ncbi:MAG: LptE family protein [candidate division WOR-3 bacterium]
MWLILGCGYSTRSLLPSHLKTVAIASVENSTTQPGLSEDLNLTLLKTFIADRNLRVTSSQQADLSLAVKVVGYSRSAAAYDANQNISAYEITLTANFDAFDQVRNENFFSGTAISRVVYDPNSKQEEDVRQEAIEKLSKEIVRQVLTAW